MGCPLYHCKVRAMFCIQVGIAVLHMILCNIVPCYNDAVSYQLIEARGT